jgi:uncharacterized protein (TIGR02271 family)
MTTRTITAMFDDRAEAERAVEALATTVGLDRSAIRMEAGSGASAASETAEDTGFFASLKDLFVPDEDRYAYAEGLRRGSVLVTAQVEEARIDHAMDVLEQHGAVDLDQREVEWRESGWTGAAGAGTGAVLGTVSDGNRTGVVAMPDTGVSTPDGTLGNPSGTMLSRSVDQVAGTNISGAHPESEGAAGMAGTATATGTLQGEEAIPIVEERLRVGKREVNRGQVRVRSYVVETPVEEQVTLREEHVDVERRAADRPVTDADRLFEERTIEVTETNEEAVIAKEVRVKEELVISKDVEDEVQTVKDKVRHTEVEIDDDRRTAGTTTGPAVTNATTTDTARTPDRDRI